MRAVLGAVILGATLFSVMRVPRVAGVLRARAGHPGAWLLAVTALIFLNQVLFTVYVVREHHGDPGFVAGYLPDGWFDLADLGWFAQWFPAPGLLSWSVLRVQAFLELPFVLLAYLTVCRWLDAEVYRRAVRLIWAASAAYTITFCLIEWSLRNPYTTDDLVIRLVSGVVVPLGVSRFAGAGDGRVRSLPDLLAFVVSASVLGYLVLVVYDTALLYNLGHLTAALPGAVIAALVLVLARLYTRVAGDRPAGPAGMALIRSLGWFLALFFVPALAIRYGLNFGLPALSAVAGLVIVLAAAIRGWTRDLLVKLVMALAVGVVAAAAGYALTVGYPELRLLGAMGAFCVTVVGVTALLDRNLTASP